MTRDEKLALAGDYVLGLLEGADLAVFEAARRTDPELDRIAQDLAASLHRLDETAEPVAPRPGLWQRIEAAIGDQDRAPSPSTVAAPPAPAHQRLATLPRRLAAAAALVAAVGLGFLLALVSAGPRDPVAVAILLDEATAEPGALVEVYADDTIRMSLLRAYDVPAGRVMEVWTLPDRQTGPVSLGTLADGRSARLAGPDLADPADGQLYEITLEPLPRSPTGRPTGPILVKGFARQPR